MAQFEKKLWTPSDSNFSMKVQSNSSFVNIFLLLFNLIDFSTISFESDKNLDSK